MFIRKKYFHAALLVICLFSITGFPLRADETAAPVMAVQPAYINALLAQEKSPERKQAIETMLSKIDDVYGNLYQNLQSGKKFVIFVDPAHGRIKDGRWEGEATGRIGINGKREELYAMPIIQLLYKRLAANPYISVQSTPDFLEVMQGKSVEYRKVYFSETIARAEAADAFIIISEHLNNVSIIHKADGLLNISGIHITTDYSGRRYLAMLMGEHKGFLTLYNKHDVTGFSKYYSDAIKKRLVAAGLRPSSWEYGSVADDRFIYFTHFPISVIYESGFISNPVDEKIVSDPKAQELLAETQYTALLESIKNVWGVDISGRRPEQISATTDQVNILKISRIAFYYIQQGEMKSAVDAITIMEKNFRSTEYGYLLYPYSGFKRNLVNANFNYQKAQYYKKIKNFRAACDYISRSKQCLSLNPIFNSMHEILAKEYNDMACKCNRRTMNYQLSHYGYPNSLDTIPETELASKVGPCTPFILTIEENESIESAVQKSLAPGDQKTAALIIQSVKQARVCSRELSVTYNKARKRNVYAWKTAYYPLNGRNGIYVIQLDKRLKVKSAVKVRKVALDGRYYQNQQYLKNSFFANIERERSL